MTYEERSEMNNLTANQQFYNTRETVDFTNLAASGAVGTVIAYDGLTGRAIANIADGLARSDSIAGSNQLGITSGAFMGGYNDGRGV